MDQDTSRGSTRTVGIARGRSRRRLKHRSRGNALRRFPPLQLSSTPSVDARSVVVALAGPALPNGAATPDLDTLETTSPLALPGERAATLRVAML